MVRLLPETKQGALRALYLTVSQQAGAGDGAPALRLIDALNAFTMGSWERMKAGRTMSASTGGGRSVQFAPPQIWQSFSLENFTALAEELQAVYPQAIADLAGQGITASDDGGPGTALIFQSMRAQLEMQDISVVYSDFTLLGWPTRGA